MNILQYFYLHERFIVKESLLLREIILKNCQQRKNNIEADKLSG